MAETATQIESGGERVQYVFDKLLNWESPQFFSILKKSITILSVHFLFTFLISSDRAAGSFLHM